MRSSASRRRFRVCPSSCRVTASNVERASSRSCAMRRSMSFSRPAVTSREMAVAVRLISSLSEARRSRSEAGSCCARSRRSPARSRARLEPCDRLVLLDAPARELLAGLAHVIGEILGGVEDGAALRGQPIAVRGGRRGGRCRCRRLVRFHLTAGRRRRRPASSDSSSDPQPPTSSAPVAITAPSGRLIRRARRAWLGDRVRRGRAWRPPGRSPRRP